MSAAVLTKPGIPDLEWPDDEPCCEVFPDEQAEEADQPCGKTAAALMLCEVRHLGDCPLGQIRNWTLWACHEHVEDVRAGQITCRSCTGRVMLVCCL